jgi:hypothetical protein
MCFRIRMKFGHKGEDFSQRIWEAGLVGIWFGAWDIQDLYDAYDAYPGIARERVTNTQIATFLNTTLVRRGLPANVSSADAALGKRFDELLPDTWMFAYYNRTLHVGQLAEEDTHDGPVHFNVYGDHFKSKLIRNTKAFPLSELPEAFLVLPSAGQGTLHKLHGSAPLAQLLVNAAYSGEVVEAIQRLSLREWIDVLGPKGWESICCAYLMQMHGFLSTGLLTGGTLADYDIVGKDLTGKRIYAQCKKSPKPYGVSEADRSAFAQLQDAHKFYFAFNGIAGDPIEDVEHISGDQIFAWLEQDAIGKRYARILR